MVDQETYSAAGHPIDRSGTESDQKMKEEAQSS